MTDEDDTLLEYESELVIGRRAFSVAQGFFALFNGVTRSVSPVYVSWHGTAVDLNEGSFAVVKTGGPLEDLVGEIIRVTVGRRSVYAYVATESATLQTDLTLAQRAFMAIGLLAQPPSGVRATVEVMS